MNTWDKRSRIPTKERTDSMRNRIINALIELGLPVNVKGFKYIVEIISKYAEDEELMSGKLEVFYYILGKKDGVSSQMIERNIRTSFGIIYKKGDPDVVRKYLPFQIRTNGNSLATLYLRLKQEEENENAKRAGKEE